MFKKISRWFRKPSNPSGHVYYARLDTPQGVFYKLGYTAKDSLVERLAYGNEGHEKLVAKEFFFTRREDAWHIEQDLLDHFAKQRAFSKYSKDPNMPLCGNGQTELFRDDVLGLDEDLYKPLDDETMKALREERNEFGLGCLMILASLVGLILVPITFGGSLVIVLLVLFLGISGGIRQEAAFRAERQTTADSPARNPSLNRRASSRL